MLDDIIELMKAMQTHHVDELVWEKDDEKIKLKASHPGRVVQVKAEAEEQDASDDLMAGYDWSEIIESPVVGTCLLYTSLRPAGHPTARRCRR